MKFFETDNYNDFKAVVAQYEVGGKVFYASTGIFVVPHQGEVISCSLSSGVPSFATVQGDFTNAIQLAGQSYFN